MKDVIRRRYASGRCLITYDPEISEWGNPPVIGRNLCYADAHPGKYPEEKKENSILQVAASENREAQTTGSNT